MTRVLNFIGGPGAGKSTTAAGVYYELKKRQIACEYVGEYAKDVTFEGTHTLLENQLHIFSEQYRRQWRLLGKVEYIITDSPLLLSCVYHPYKNHNPKYIAHAKAFFIATFNQFDNLTFLVAHGRRAYAQYGRNQNLEEAQSIHRSVRTLLCDKRIPFIDIEPADAGVASVLRAIGVDAV